MTFWQRVVLVCAFLAGMYASPLFAQGALPAATGCIGDSVVTVFQPSIEADSLARGELDAHEAVHRAQLDSLMHATHVSCYVALLSMTMSYEANLRFEAPAYRAQGDWNEAHRPGFDRREFDLTVARALLFYYESRIPLGTIFAEVAQHNAAPWAEEGIDLSPGTTVTGTWSSWWKLSDPLTNHVVRRGYQR